MRPLSPLLLAALLTTRLLGPSPAAGIQQTGSGSQSGVAAVASAAVDSLFRAMDALGSYNRAEAHLRGASRDFEAQWRASRAALVLGVMSTGWGARDRWFRKAVAHGEEARRLNPRDPEGVAWLAAAVGRRAMESRSPRENARMGRRVWDLTETVLAEDPTHPLGNGVRGKLHQEVMKLAPWQRALGRVLLRSDALKRANWAASEAHLRRAIQGDPTVILFYLDLGETYWLQQKYQLARETFEAGLRLPSLYPPDELFKGQIRRALQRRPAATSGRSTSPTGEPERTRPARRH